MTRILNTTAFPIDTNVSDADYVIGTDGDNKLKTKNFTIGSLKTHILGFSDSLPVDGIENADGTYTWVKYSASADGSAMSDYPEGMTYIGLAYNNPDGEESADPLDYTWTLIDGSILQPNGKYTWLKYATTPDATVLYNLPTDMEWMGLAIDQAEALESEDYRDYEWHRFAQNAEDILVQNNLVRVIEIPAADLTSEDEQGIADWMNTNGLLVYEDENILFQIIGATPPVGETPDLDPNEPPEPPIPELDPDISLDLTVGAVDETTAVLNWNPNGDTTIVRYSLYYYEPLGNTTVIYYTTELTDTITGLTDGTDYEAHIFGYDTTGNQKISNTVFFTTPEIFVPTTPNIWVTEITDTETLLWWSVESSFNADRYELFRDDVFIAALNEIDGTYWRDTLLTPETLYQYHVIAYSGATASNQSDTLDVTTLAAVAPPLSTPLFNILLVTDNRVDISIKTLVQLQYELDRILGWQIQTRVTGNTTWGASEEFANPTRIISITDLVPDTSYDFRVRSFDAESTSEWSAIKTTRTLATASNIGAVMNLTVNTPPIAEGNFWTMKGAKNGTVKVRVSLLVTQNNTPIISSITFPYFGESITSSTSKTFTLDLNGGGNSTLSDGYFTIDVGNEVGVKYKITATIISSSNGLGIPYSQTVTYTHLTNIGL